MCVCVFVWECQEWVGGEEWETGAQEEDSTRRDKDSSGAVLGINMSMPCLWVQ